MTLSHQAINSRASLAAACALGTLGVIIFAVLPMLLGVIADHLQLDDTQTGMVASLYYLAYFVVTLLSVIWVRRLSWRVLAPLGCGLMATGLVISAGMGDSYYGVLAGIMLSGLGAAVVYSLSVTLVSDMAEKDRCFAIKLIPEQVIPAVLVFLLPVMVVDQFGLPGMLLALVAVVVLLSLFVRKIPAKGNNDQEKVSSSYQGRSAVFIGLFALVLFFSGFAALWAFSERLAHDALEQELVGQLLALGLISSAIGPFIAALIADRWGRYLPLTSGVFLSLIAMLFIVGDITALRFALFMALFPSAYYFSLAYVFGIISDADLSGRFSCLIASALALGAAIGPGVFGVLLDTVGHYAGYLFAGLTILLGCAVFIWLEHRLQQLAFKPVANQETVNPVNG